MITKQIEITKDEVDDLIIKIIKFLPGLDKDQIEKHYHWTAHKIQTNNKENIPLPDYLGIFVIDNLLLKNKIKKVKINNKEKYFDINFSEDQINLLIIES